VPCLGPARRAGVAAQALRGHRAGPALSTIDRDSGRARVVLFRVVPRAANRARPIWNTIVPFASQIELPRFKDLCEPHASDTGFADNFCFARVLLCKSVMPFYNNNYQGRSWAGPAPKATPWADFNFLTCTLFATVFEVVKLGLCLRPWPGWP
jgi:hypothetical protein